VKGAFAVTFTGLLAAVVVAIAAQVPVSMSMGQAPQGAPQAFEATWSATGQRQRLPTERGRPASTVQMSGAVSITAGAGLSRGFRGEVIGFDDGAGVISGRVVWTDQRGDRIFSTLRGEALAAGRRIVGIITGGTGRYAGLAGEYGFQWQYLLDGEDGRVSGRAIDLRGQVRVGSAAR